MDVVKSLKKNDTAMRVVPEGLRHYFDQRILPFQWYPEEDVQALMAILADHLPGERHRVLEEMGRTQALVHLNELYSNMIKAGDPLRTFQRVVATLWSTQHDTGKLRISEEGPDWVEVELSDYGAPSDVMCTAVGGYMAGTLQAGGASNVRPTTLRCRAHGHESCRWRLEWR